RKPRRRKRATASGRPPRDRKRCFRNQRLRRPASRGDAGAVGALRFSEAQGMRAKGINYDTGFISAGTTTHEPFDAETVKREMQIIHRDLHCNAVRITGGDPERLEIAARHASDAGLEVWFCPVTNNLPNADLL